MNYADMSREELLREIETLHHKLDIQQQIFYELEAHYHSVFEAAQEGIIVHEHGRVLDANPAFLKLFGYPPDEPERLIGSQVLKMVAPDYHHVVEEALRLHRNDPYEVMGLRRDGSTFPVEVIAKDYAFQGRMVRVAVVHDISSRKAIDSARQEQKTLAEALRDSAAALNSSLDPDTVMKRILENVGRVVPHDTANIMLLDGDTARMVYWSGYREEHIAFFRDFVFDLNQFETLKTMLRTKKPLAIPDTSRYSQWLQADHTTGLRSYAAAPIRLGDEIIGFLNLDSHTPNALTDIHAERLQAFADQAAIAINNARLYDQMRRQAEALRESEAHLRAILDALPDSMFRMNREGLILEAKAPPGDFIQPERLIGRMLHQVVPPDIAEQGLYYVERALTTGDMQVYEYQVPRLDGLRDFEARVVICGEDEVLAIIRDITARKQAEKELADARDKALEASRVKSQFLANMSHELRTPLNSIINYTQLVVEGMYGAVTQTQQDRLEKVIRNGRNLLSLINDVLDLSKIEAGHMTLNHKLIETDEFLEAILQIFRPMAEEKGLLLVYAGRGAPPIYADETRARQVLTNIIGNAVKFTHQGGITVSTQVQGEMLCFVVEDTGIGIPPEAQSKIFDEFRQADNSSTREYEGTGLGLTISKRIAEMHGGTIWLESEVGKGSIFYVTFPLSST